MLYVVVEVSLVALTSELFTFKDLIAFQQVCVPLHILCCFISVYSPFEQVNKIKGLVSRV